MHAANWRRRAQHLSLCALAFSIPFPFRVATIATLVAAACWLLQPFLRESLRNLRRSPVLLGWMAFYLLHALSYFWSDNKADSLFDLESKLSFFALPLIIGAAADIGRREMEQVLSSLAAGVAAVAAFCLLRAGQLYFSAGESHFFYHPLVAGFDANAVYQAWYALTALALLLLWPWKHVFRRQALRWALVLLVAVFFVLLSSRTLLLFFVLFMVPLYLLRLWRRQGLSRLVAIAGGLALVGTLLLLFGLDNPVRRRYQEVMHNDVAQAYLPDYHGRTPVFNNLTLRLFLWRVAVDNVRERELWAGGAGNGDTHQVQNERMAALGITGMNDPEHRSHLYNVNTHNMYLQSLLMLGLPGLLLFLWLAFSPLAALRGLAGNSFYFLFHASCLLFFLQEAALQTQAGIIFYLFMTALFWNWRRRYERAVNSV